MELNNKSLECWTKEENDLVMERGLFAVAVNFGEGECVEQEIYEYDPMLDSILNLSAEIIHDGMGYILHSLIKFNIEKQYLVIVNNYAQCVGQIIGHYDSRDEAVTTIQRKTCDIVAKCKVNYDERYTTYVIIDLSQCIPFFLKVGKLRKPPKMSKRNPVCEFIHPCPSFTTSDEETVNSSFEKSEDDL
jgi:hypothetical protein